MFQSAPTRNSESMGFSQAGTLHSRPRRIGREAARIEFPVVFQKHEAREEESAKMSLMLSDQRWLFPCISWDLKGKETTKTNHTSYVHVLKRSIPTISNSPISVSKHQCYALRSSSQTTTQLEAVWRVSSPWIQWKPQLKSCSSHRWQRFVRKMFRKPQPFAASLNPPKKSWFANKNEEFPYGSKGLKWWTMVGKKKHPPGRTQRNRRNFPPHRWWLLALSPAGWPR